MLKIKGNWLKQDFRDSPSEPSQPARIQTSFNIMPSLNLAKIKLLTLYIHRTHGLISYKVREQINKAGMKTKVCWRLEFPQKATVSATVAAQIAIMSQLSK